MKKLFLLLLLIPFIIGCSSDDNDDDNANIGLTEYSVHFLWGIKDLENAFKEFSTSVFIVSSTNSPSGSVGLGGIIVSKPNNKILVYDSACPYEWDKYDEYSSLRRTDEIKDNEVRCEDCQSVFNLNTGKSVSGMAKEKGLNLVSYKVEKKDEDTDIPYYLFTNPRYKE